MNSQAQYPRLVADIGGTNARFSIESSPLELTFIDVLPCKDYPTLLAAIHHYLDTVEQQPAHMAIAIANPVNGDFIQMTNHHWQFSIKQMQQQLGLETLTVINDFTAQALATRVISADYVIQIGGQCQRGVSTAPVAVIGPGTGLGVSGLIADNSGRWIALSSEGGHAAFAPRDEVEKALLDFAGKKFAHHVSAERLLQGAGLSLLYEFFAHQNDVSSSQIKSPADVTRGALIEKDPLCQQALSRYCKILGNFCADVALTIGATGGVYIAGGIIPRFVDFVKDSEFRQQFESKGRFENYMQNIPVYVVLHPQPGLLGAAVALEHHLSNVE